MQLLWLCRLVAGAATATTTAAVAGIPATSGVPAAVVAISAATNTPSARAAIDVAAALSLLQMAASPVTAAAAASVNIVGAMTAVPPCCRCL